MAERPVEYLARKGDGAMDAESFASVVKTAIAQCVQFTDELSIDRAKATEYYLGKPFGNEEEGRSQVILTEVRDAVDGMLPSLMRVFFGPEHTVEFVPSRAETVEQAAQKTDYVRYVFEEDNAGFLRTMDVLKDGLVRKIGIYKWGWDESVQTHAFKREGVTEEELHALAAADEVTLVKGGTTKRPDGLYDVQLTTTEQGGRARIWSVPPEEFLYNRQARDLDEALIVAHRTEKTRGQLLAMGVSAKVLDEHAGTDKALSDNPEELARRDSARVGAAIGSGAANDPEMGKANDKILYTEAWMTVDFDGDGVAELRRICTVGTGYYPVKNDPAEERPFAIFTPYPEPHTLTGGSVADRTMDVQKITSSVLRGMLDSASLAIFPRMAYLEGQASVADIMNTAIGAPMRERVTGAIRPVVTPFTGKEMMPVLGFMQEVIERRTGRNKGAAGLDADALQSTGKEAVGAVLSGSQEQIEVIARVFAEMALKPLFRGVGRLIHSKQPKARMVKLRGRWVDVTPASWDANMDVSVNVALGTTFTDKKIATLMAVAADQKELAMATGGLMSPFVPMPKIMATRAKLLSLQGIKDFESYYNQLPPDWQPPPPPPPQPNPEEMWVQAEKEMNHKKVMKELAIKADELAFKREEALWQRDFELRKLAADVATKKYIADAANQQTASQAELTHRIDMEAKEAELTINAHESVNRLQLEREKHEHDMALERDRHEHEKAMAEKQTETPEATE